MQRENKSLLYSNLKDNADLKLRDWGNKVLILGKDEDGNETRKIISLSLPPVDIKEVVASYTSDDATDSASKAD